ncbi:MAG: hypothetical protein RL065_1014 [Bacteroidota bacterium]|jgi:D-ribose pyranose/furanose isomerase RbsD
MKNKLSLIFIFIAAVIFFRCKKDASICDAYQPIIESKHLIDISILKSIAPELMDTITTHSNLQVYRLINEDNLIIIHCNDFDKDLKNLSRQFTFEKNLKDNSIFSFETYVHDTLSTSSKPTVSIVRAIEIAKATINFNGICPYYRLGIYNNFVPSEYRLVWYIQDKKDNMHVMIDAKTEKVYSSFDGKIYN